MDVNPDKQVAAMEDIAALPRQNGELLFEAPWEGHAFGLAVALNHGGQYEWREFHQRFVDEIARAEAGNATSTYYERWLASLERLLAEKGFVSAEELERRAREIESAQHAEHEHDHDHAP